MTFISGPARCGTTLLQTVLCALLGSPFLPEITFLPAVINYRTNYMKIGGPYRLEMFGCDGSTLDRAAARFIEEILAEALTSPNLVLKSPNLTDAIPELHRFFLKSIRSVCIVRDPKDAIASLMWVREREGKPRDLVEAADFLGGRYDDVVSAIERQHPDNPVHLIRYEDLVRRDPAALAALGSFVGAPITFGDPLDEGGFDPTNPWHSPFYTKPITAERVGSYKDYLTPDEIGAIDESYARFYERFGYARHEEIPSVSKAA